MRFEFYNLYSNNIPRIAASFLLTFARKLIEYNRTYNVKVFTVTTQGRQWRRPPAIIKSRWHTQLYSLPISNPVVEREAILQKPRQRQTVGRKNFSLRSKLEKKSNRFFLGRWDNDKNQQYKMIDIHQMGIYENCTVPFAKHPGLLY